MQTITTPGLSTVGLVKQNQNQFKNRLVSRSRARLNCRVGCFCVRACVCNTLCMCVCMCGENRSDFVVEKQEPPLKAKQLWQFGDDTNFRTESIAFRVQAVAAAILCVRFWQLID